MERGATGLALAQVARNDSVTSVEMANYRSELRAAVARELHDGPVQSLTESVIRLERYRGAASNRAMQSAISDVEESVRVALMSLRHLIRDLRDEPPSEDVAGSVREMACRFQASTGVQIAVVTSPAWPELMPAATALNLIRIVQEAITNAIRHGHAEQILIELRSSEGVLTASVVDDGTGMTDESLPGSGLIGMRERAALLGGRLEIRGRHPGTEVRVEVPSP